MLETPVALTPEVISAINEELTYTASLHSKGRADTRDHGVEGQLVTLEAYTRKAMDAWVHGKGCEPSLDVLRKIAGIVCGALIKYGCPRREMPVEIKDWRPSTRGCPNED